jgi:hypothetical protein
MYSGVQTAQIILGYASTDEFLRSMMSWELPWLVGW